MSSKLISATALILLAASPAIADNESLPARTIAGSDRGDARIEQQLDRREREAYRAIFAAIRNQDWASVEERLDDAPDSILEPVARAEYYLDPASPRIELQPLMALLAEAPDLPGARDLARLAEARGMERLPAALPPTHELRRLSGPSRRSRARPSSDAATRALVDRIHPLIVADSPCEAERLVDEIGSTLPSEGLTEVRQRVAWSYYLTGDDTNARRVAQLARRGSGEWAVHADWVDGLASWRQRDCNAAAEAFGAVGRRASDSELMAAGLYWAARAEMACGRPQNVQAQLRTAARMRETFYGLLAAQTLGIAAQTHVQAAGFMPGWNTVADHSNARRAMALIEIGEAQLAGRYLRHGAALDEPQRHDAWVDLASVLGLPDTELWLAQNAPAGHHPTARDRFPSPAYRPASGWRVDRSLVYAHALQESNFRPDAVSHAGARGLLQLMPGTAGDIARDRGESVEPASLNRPEINIEYGQTYMESMRDFPGTQGLLPKVIASYNAGPGSVADWEGRLRDRGDPLLYIESIPFVETRHYVPIVLRNYWMYQRNAGEQASSLSALAQGMWPRFPGSPGPVAVRLSGHGGTRVAD